MSIEQKYQEIDFSQLSHVKDSLKARLMEKREKKRELSWDELDNLAAAGGSNPAQLAKNPINK
ncbi:hypothetical protein D081_0674 [Anaerovibrio sp. JC8]|uniref:hypothetical protein n=1 Tax=Anaerovibrio sp. JC8 TaxID=1240085 RepID=UPI000A0AAA27|nr:hypothetical protein [Anaerovibrio sp. JC8]ORU00692.1 hypothetical protein D081_0674 [Anaerovibrio sp. JC8]